LPLALLLVLSGGLPAVADEKADIQDVVFDAMRAGFERGNLAEYMKVWTDDAKLIECREEKPGKYDHALNRKQLEAFCRLIFSDLPEGGYKITFESPRVEIEDDKAELRVMTTLKYDGEGENFDKMSEIYLLRRTRDGWHVYENRVWPVELQEGDKTIDYDAKGWKLLDDIVEAAQKEDDLPKLIEALEDARRSVEAHKVAQKLTAREGATAEDWVHRGWLAAQVGDGDDATKAFREALKLDPEALVPSAFNVDKKDAVKRIPTPLRTPLKKTKQ
jgi:hypothetical protein